MKNPLIPENPTAPPPAAGELTETLLHMERIANDDTCVEEIGVFDRAGRLRELWIQISQLRLLLTVPPPAVEQETVRENPLEEKRDVAANTVQGQA